MTPTNYEPFRAMLLWSGILHIFLLLVLVLVASLGTSAPFAPQEHIAMVIPGLPEALPTSGDSRSPTPPLPAPEPEVTPETTKEVVRPTTEQREQIPLPDAKSRRPSRLVKPKQDSGLRGADAASAKSAQLKTLGLPGLGLGNSTGENSAFDQPFEYAYYATQMLSKINQHWQRHRVRGVATVIIKFSIMRNGSIASPNVETSGGVRLLDRSALRAVMLSDPLPPLPNSYPNDTVGVHLRFTYSNE